MEAVKRKFVTPGAVITSGPYRPEQNVILDGRNLVSTVVGISEIFDGTVRVIPVTGKYYPKTNDMVIGKVTTNTSLSWELDIASSYVGVLPASDVFGRSFSAHADELFTRLRPGDLVAAKVANFDRTRDPLLTVSEPELGKIESGDLIEMPSSKVPRLIGKRGSMIQMIETATGAIVTIGQNGRIVVSCDNSDGLLKAKKAIHLIDEKVHAPNLADQVKAVLEVDGEQ